MKSKLNSLGSTLLLGAVLLPLCAVASPPPDQMVTVAKTVKYDPAQAGTPEGAAKLYDALDVAASRVCRTAGAPALPYGSAYSACKSTALTKAVNDLDIAAVTAIYARTHKMPASQDLMAVASR